MDYCIGDYDEQREESSQNWGRKGAKEGAQKERERKVREKSTERKRENESVEREREQGVCEITADNRVPIRA